MECSDIQRNDRKDFNSLMYHFIAGRDSQITHYKDKEEVLNQKLMWYCWRFVFVFIYKVWTSLFLIEKSKGWVLEKICLFKLKFMSDPLTGSIGDSSSINDKSLLGSSNKKYTNMLENGFSFLLLGYNIECFKCLSDHYPFNPNLCLISWRHHFNQSSMKITP